MAEPLRLGVQHRIFGGGAGVADGRERQAAGKHLEQHHAERKHIRCDANRRAGDLLRRSVAQGQAAAGLARQLAGIFHVVKQAGDAEVEQLGRAVVGDHHIRWFQVAMHDELGVRMLHRLGDPDQQLDPRGDRRAGSGQMLVQRAADHVFEHQKGLVVCHAGIQQLGDARVVQPRQRRAFAGEAGRKLGSLHVSAKQLDCGPRVVQAIRAARQPHLAHAAFTDFCFQPPGAHAPAGQRGRVGRRHCRLLQCLLQQGVEGRWRRAVRRSGR